MESSLDRHRERPHHASQFNKSDDQLAHASHSIVPTLISSDRSDITRALENTVRNETPRLLKSGRGA
jgi:hypothetical protein